ncbi:MAG: non-ribosomal peptide synthetase, partial [Legionella longbeachae]|nr:non-ribosomal peptide synthetase [Legionella longbeachae]
FYLNYNQLSINDIIMDSHFKEYIFNERHTLKMHLENDIHFWEEYLKDTSLFTFPEEFVVSNMKAQKLPYSTYSVIPEDVIDHFKYFCEQNHISINHGLSAAITLALRNCCGDTSEAPYTYLNIIQSTRDNPIYDETIGCFLRVEPTKVRLNDTSTLISLSQQIRQSIIDTSNHQQCSNLVKLCAISSFKPNIIENYLINLITPLYTKLLKIPSLYRDILQRCGSRIISFKRNTKFFLNLNIRDNFITDSSEKKLFGLNIKQVDNHNEDLLALDYIFEASFFHDDNQNTHYLVISANLLPDFRERIAKEVFHIIKSLFPEQSTHKSNINNESTKQLL